jgi:two-component system cell cycle sensor histidine kinase/response regulator CckA
VVLDLTMPHMNGDETLREIHRTKPDVPVILSSGYSETQAASRLKGVTIVGFLQKPYRPSELLTILRKVLEPKEE